MVNFCHHISKVLPRIGRQGIRQVCCVPESDIANTRYHSSGQAKGNGGGYVAGAIRLTEGLQGFEFGGHNIYQ